MPEDRDAPLAPSDDQVLHSIGQAIIVTDVTGTVTTWNAAAERLYGWSPDEAVGRSIDTLTAPEIPPDDAENLRTALQGGDPWSGCVTVQHKDRSVFRALVTMSSVRTDGGAIQAIVGVSSALGEAVQPLLEQFVDAATIVGPDGLIRFASPSVTNVFGWSPANLVGQPAVSLVHPDDGMLLERVLRRAGNGNGHSPLELRVRARDGSWRWAEAAVSDLTTDPDVRGVIIQLRDVTDRRAAHERLTRLALHDPLTGLPNRALIADRIQHSHARRGQAGALLLLDLDGFKEVNRLYGHAAGDELMRTLAARLDQALAVVDTCGRLGGDEFVVLAESVHNPVEAVELAERLQVSLARPVRVDGAHLVQTACVGVTLLAGRRRSHELLRECVAAVFDAKVAGRGRVMLFDSIGTDSFPAGGLVKRLRQGLINGEVLVYYQPIIDLGTRHVVGVEALVRWDHVRYGLLSAARFIEAAEADDLIHDLGAYVLRQACQQVSRWQDSDLHLSVNVSARQLSDPGLADTVRQSLADSGLAPHRLILEITETALMQDLSTALEVLVACRGQGVRISLDDFGTGFAGFGYLRELPVDEVKIDRSFIDGLSTNGSGAAIVTGIVQMARGLGLQTTGEGVETSRQARILTELGCDRAQGFLWSPAVPATDRAPDFDGAL